jgi:hypothetical protein
MRKKIIFGELQGEKGRPSFDLYEIFIDGNEVACKDIILTVLHPASMSDDAYISYCLTVIVGRLFVRIDPDRIKVLCVFDEDKQEVKVNA